MEDGLTPLHEATGAGSIAVAEMLIRAGAEVGTPFTSKQEGSLLFKPSAVSEIPGANYSPLTHLGNTRQPGRWGAVCV